MPTRSTMSAIIEFSNPNLPHPDACYCFDNGVEVFGKDDPEIRSIREQRGEMADNLIGVPRLILYRSHQHAPVYAKLCYTLTFDGQGDFDEVLTLLNFTKYCLSRDSERPFVAPSVLFDAHAVFWEGSYDKTLEIEFASAYRNWDDLAREWTGFFQDLFPDSSRSNL